MVVRFTVGWPYWTALIWCVSSGLAVGLQAHLGGVCLKETESLVVASSDLTVDCVAYIRELSLAVVVGDAPRAEAAITCLGIARSAGAAAVDESLIDFMGYDDDGKDDGEDDGDAVEVT